MIIEFTKQNTSILDKQVIVMKGYLKEASNLIDGTYKIQKGLESIYFEKNVDWNYKHQISSNTFQLYLHTLNFNNNLVRAYIETLDTKYIIKAKDIIESWIKSNLNKNDKKNYAWYDHTVSSRLQNLLYFQCHAPVKQKIKKKKFERIFEKHLDFLVKYKNYTENNHGIMMDRAVAIGALFLEKEEIRNEYLMLAKNRIEKAILRDYSYKNVHLENSPDYHRMVTNWLNKVVKLFDDIKMPLSSKYKNKLKGAVLFDSIISNYNNEYPMIGDTGHGKTKEKKNHIDFIDYESGIAILNDKDTKATLVFNCGYKNLTHKHKDDLSFTLSINKEQILVDSGKYNYNKNDEIRKYMISPMAHTTLLVQNQEYVLNYDNVIELTASYIHKDYKIVKGQHKGYKNINLERTIICLNNGIYLVIDKANSSDENTYIQNFVLDSKITIEELSKRKYLLTTEKKYEYILQEHSVVAASKVLSGQKTKAMISKEFNKLEDTKRIEIRKKQRNSIFISSISPKSLEIESIEFDSEFVKINLGNEKKVISID